MNRLILALILVGYLTLQTGCTKSDDDGGSHTHADGTTHDDHDDHDHDDHDDGDHDGDRLEDALGLDDSDGGGHDDDHGHDEVPLEPVTIDGMEIELAQGHGPVEAGVESHLVVKLPYSDGGTTIVRAWIGTEDRTLSMVGLGEYAPSHDDYDIHAMAPDPLPEDAMWWIEIEGPDGERVVGSAEPIR